MSTSGNPNYFNYSTTNLRRSANQIANFVKSLFFLYLKYIYVLFAILLLLALYHFFIYQKSEKSYISEVHLVQNFESANYLYSSIEAINSKIKTYDSVFLKQVFGPRFEQIEEVKIEPVSDLFDFSSKTKNTIEIFKLLNEGHDAVANLTTYRNSPFFKQHSLELTSRGFGSSVDLTKNLVAYLNDNEHFREYGEVIRENTQLEIEDTKKSLEQINGILDHISEIPASSGSVYNINQDHSALIREKRMLINNLLILEIRLKDADSIIKVTDFVYDKKVKDSFPRKFLYVILAHLFYFAFLGFMWFWKRRA